MGLELVTRYLPPGLCREDGGASQVPGGPRCERALFSDPGGIADARPLRRRDAAFRQDDDVGSRDHENFGAQSHGPLPHCLRFAMPVARSLRKTRFRLLASSAGRGLVPRKVPSKGFSTIVHSPFPSFPGAPSWFL